MIYERPDAKGDLKLNEVVIPGAAGKTLRHLREQTLNELMAYSVGPGLSCAKCHFNYLCWKKELHPALGLPFQF